MLLHIVPKIYMPFGGVASVVDIYIPECGLVLTGGKDVTARQPYPNKRYHVACKKVGRKAMDGILVDMDGTLQKYTVITRWLVEREVITHVVEHVVLDTDFDAVSDNMIMWNGLYGTDLKNRTPDFYKTAPVSIQPSMDTVTAAYGGLARSDDVRDIVNGDYVIQRIELFKVPSIEPDRILNGFGGHSGRTPSISDAFVAKPVDPSPLSIALSNDITATILVVPLPNKDSKGNYPKRPADSISPDIYLSFHRGNEVLSSMVPWNNVIESGDRYEINPAFSLDEEDLYKIDNEGWDMLFAYGIYPTELILRDFSQ